MKKLILLSLIALVFVFSSCKKDRFDEPKAPEKMEELAVPASFDWKTTKDYSVTLSAYTNGIVEVTNSAGAVYQKAFLSTGQPYTMKLTVPSYETTIRLKFMGKTQDIALSSSNISYQFVAQ
jgi:hypothetical protein